MPSLVPSDTVIAMTGALGDHFDTFARNIIIFKEPLQTFTTIESNTYFGYGEANINEPNVSYTDVSGIYPAIRLYRNEQPIVNLHEIKAWIQDGGKVRIKVKKDAKDYIENGKTERVVVDGLTFNINSNMSVQNFLGLEYYIYYLEGTT